MKRLFISLFFVAFVCDVLSVGYLHGTYTSVYGTYYEFFSDDSVVIGDTIEGDSYRYIIHNDTLFLSSDLLNVKDTCLFNLKDNVLQLSYDYGTTYFFQFRVRKTSR
jgi:hypothetical protein